MEKLARIGFGVALALAALTVSAEAKFKVLHDFCETGTCARTFSNAGLLIDAAGNLYGATSDDGLHGKGTVFKLSRGRHNRWSYQVLHDFCSQASCTDGANSRSGLVIDTAGNLFGTTFNGGATNMGTFFEVTAAGEYKVLYSFCPDTQNCSDGANPVGTLTYAGALSGVPYDGTSPLYGTAGGQSHNVVFSLTPSGDSWQEAVAYNSPCTFCFPEGVVMDGAGKLYGVYSFDGEVYALTHTDQGWVRTSDGGMHGGSDPHGLLAIDAQGHLFGTTETGGGPQNGGTLYRLTPVVDTFVLKTLHNFGDQRDGRAPTSGVILDDAGNLYGTADFGSKFNGGSVYKLSGRKLSVLHAFCRHKKCLDGSTVLAPVVRDKDGNLFGMTTQGGAHGFGTLFEIMPDAP
ncbi:MAG TPA: choice-of-anchor tandem repeat GloVer-containing protein [Rhizomicrobium sp.]|nr:choice-of-anchor tandem repeat GloVer-containing protein [Rhizomicrobium sp.]